ncbi:MAG: succinylglutamate desuccinylase/aspartoacylase family protein [Candidatus Schekmanbacteria bacterium]|nr:succinylglutamate desuccinylase/aspartoacylase family protein [Candidatus Schekmanbacteria bacterium]
MEVDIAHDGFGRPIRIPVLAMRGSRPGPVFGVTAAVHGNELNGIPIIHSLFASIDPQALRGTLVAVIVMNVPGYGREQRAFADGTDLNQIMPGSPTGSSARVYAHRFIDQVVRHFDYLVDLHTASFGRVNSLYVRADMSDPVTARMAYLQRPQIIVHNPPSDHTLRGAAQDLGIPAITLEAGNPHRFHRDYIRRALGGMRAVLAAADLIGGRSLAIGKQPVLCRTSYWLYTEHGGLLDVYPDVTDRVHADAVIASLANIFGDVERRYRSPESGIVIGKSVNPVAQTGARILHLGILAAEGEVFERDEASPTEAPPPHRPPLAGGDEEGAARSPESPEG